MKFLKYDYETNTADTSTSVIANGSILSKISGRSNFTSHKFHITIKFLDHNRTLSELFKKSSTGQDVVDYACQSLNIVEKYYFGLQFEDNKFRCWVDLTKPLSKQFHYKNLTFRFRFLFYPINPSRLKEAVTRYQLFVQLQRDLLHGRLICSLNDGINLAGLILQANLGNFNAETMDREADYVSQYHLLMKQSQKMEEKIAVAHINMNGLTREEAENEFLTTASKLDTYGFDPYVVKNVGQDKEIIIGANHIGLLFVLKNQNVITIKWADVEKIDYISKQLIITISKKILSSDSLSGNNEKSFLSFFYSFEKKSNLKTRITQIKFVCSSGNFAKHLWRYFLAQQVFFTEDQANLVKLKFSRPRIPLFLRGSTFRCPTSRVLHEIESEDFVPRSDGTFERYTLHKFQPRSVDEPWNSLKLTNFQSCFTDNYNNNNIAFIENKNVLSNGKINATLNENKKQSLNGVLGEKVSVENRLILTCEYLDNEAKKRKKSLQQKNGLNSHLDNSVNKENGVMNLPVFEHLSKFNAMSFFFFFFVLIIATIILVVIFYPKIFSFPPVIKLPNKFTWPSWLKSISL